MYKPLILATLSATFITLTACDTKSCDTGACDSGYIIIDDGVTAITDVNWGCDNIGYYFDIPFSGSSASADLWFAQTTDSAWTEIHTVVPSSLSEYYFELDSVYTQGVNSVVEGSTTFFDCSVHAGTEIFQFDLYNDANNAISDCALFGANTSGNVGGNGSGGYYGSGWSGACPSVW